MADPIEMVERAVLESFRPFMPDVEFRVADRGEGGPTVPAFTEGDDGAVAWVARGTHTEDWPGIGEKSGHRVVVKGATFVSADGDDGPEFFVVIDWGEVLAQIGALVVDRPVD